MPDPTVDAAWIAQHLDDPNLRVIEVDVSPNAYAAGHIPGAVLWNAYADLRDASYQPIDRAAFADLCGRSGITPDSTVVVYGFCAPLGFWLLSANGLRDVRILDGPRARWEQTGQPWSTDTPPAANGRFELPPPRDAIIATRQTVADAIDDDATVIVDVRSIPEYRGERFWPSGATEDAGRPGRVPGAVSVPIDRLRKDDGELQDPDELQRVFDEAGIDRDATIITYCTIGNRAGQAWFALHHVLGYPRVQVYYGSWVEWGKRPDTPVES